MNLPAHPHTLYKWTCAVCYVVIRTRDYEHTRREARVHAYHEHRMTTFAVPVACMWDARISGHAVLVTYDS